MNSADEGLSLLGGKYRPISLQDEWYLERPRLSSLLPKAPGVMVLEGKAGQGKSVLAASFFFNASTHRFWFSLDSEDNNATHFLQRLLDSLGDSLSESDRDHLSLALAKEVPDIARIFDVLANSIRLQIGSCVFFFDNFDALENELPTRSALLRFIGLLSQDVRFVLMSRAKIVELEMSIAQNKILFISNEQLAFDESETISLLQKLDGSASSMAFALEAFGFFAGWPLATAMLGVSLKTEYGLHTPDALRVVLVKCFDLLYRELDEQVAKEVARLSIPTTFLASQVERASGLSSLGDLVGAKGSGELVLDASFREFVSQRRSLILNEIQLRNALEQSVTEAIAAGHYVDALDQIFQLGDIERLNGFFETYGELIKSSQWHLILELLDRLSHFDLTHYPFIGLHIGRFKGEYHPADAAELICSAIDTFVEQEAFIGELKGWCYLLELQLSVLDQSGLQKSYDAIHRLLKLDLVLSLDTRVCLHIQLAGTAIYLLSDSRAAQEHLDHAQAQLAGLDMPDEQYMVYCYRCLDHIFNRRIDAAKTSSERMRNFVSVGLRESVKIWVAGACGNFLAVIGQYESLKYYLMDLDDWLDTAALEQRQMGGFFQIWQAQYSLLSGDYPKVIDRLGSALESPIFLVPGDSRRMGIILYALARSAMGDLVEASYWISKLDGFSPTPNYKARQRLSLASTYVYLEQWSKADEELAAVKDETEAGPFFSTVAHGIEAYKFHKQGKVKESRELVDRWLCGVTDQQVPGFLSVGYTFEVLQFLLETSAQLAISDQSFRQVRQRITKDYLNSNFSLDYQSIFSLDVATAPRAAINIGGVELSVTRMQKKLIFILATKEGQKLTREQVIEAIWPDQDGSDSRFYILVNRLKKKFSEYGFDLSTYLSVQSGEVRLLNANIDFEKFREMIDLANAHEKDQAPWLASALRFTALKHWEGFFDAELDALIDISRDRRSDLQSYYDTCAKLARTFPLSETNVQNLVSRLLILQSRESESLELARSLVTLYESLGDLAGIYKAKMVLTVGLQRLDIPDKEVDSIIASL